MSAFRWLLILLVIVGAFAAPLSLRFISDEIEATNTYMLIDTLDKFLMSVIIVNFSEGLFKKFAFALMVVMLNGFLDEVFFDPISYGINELFLTFSLFIYLIYSLTVWIIHRTNGTPS